MGLKKFFKGIAGALPVIGPIVGGLISNRANRRAANDQMQMQKDFAKHGVRWRVEDAKAAGIHPLAALGMQGMSPSPVFAADSLGPAISEAGQNLGRAVSAQQTPVERQMQELGLRLLQSQIGETDARRELALSEAERNRREPATTFPVDDWWSANFGAAAPSEVTSESVRPAGIVKPVAPDVVAHSVIPTADPSLMAGDTPMWRSFRITPDVSIVLPGGVSGDAAEVLESLAESPVMSMMVYQENVRRFGKDWTDRMFERYVPGWGREGWLKRSYNYVVKPWVDLPGRINRRLNDRWNRNKAF